jgi:hypothetical protein
VGRCEFLGKSVDPLETSQERKKALANDVTVANAAADPQVTPALASLVDELNIDAVAFSRSGDPATGDFSDATVIRKCGDLPEDLSALCPISA